MGESIMRDQNRGSLVGAFIFTLCALMLSIPSVQAKTKLKPGSTCELQEKITIRNKAQRKNVKTRQLDKGTTFKIVRYHRVWVRIQTSDGIAFATPKSIRKHCQAPQPAVTKPSSTPEADAKSPSSEPAAPAVKEAAAKQTEPTPPPAALAAEAQKPKPVPEAETTAKPALTPKLPVQTVQVPDIYTKVQPQSAPISPAAWIALGAGAASMGASAYFVSQLTTQDEARTGQAALLTGATGIIGVIVGLSYILSPDQRILPPSDTPENAISTAISVGPGSISVSGRF